MGTEFTFYDYVDESGNTVRAWLTGLHKKKREFFNRWIRYLEATPNGSWNRPTVETLTDECAGLFEIRERAEGYRLLGCHGTGQGTPTLLYGFTKKRGPVPPRECKKALERKARVQSQPDTYRVKHDYGPADAGLEQSKG